MRSLRVVRLIESEHMGYTAFEIVVTNSMTVNSVKQAIFTHMGSEITGEISIFHRGKRVDNGWFCGDVSPEESIVFTIDADLDLRLYGVESITNLAPATRARINVLLDRVREGFKAGMEPELAANGSGGTYFLKDADGNNIACFKPQDEEPSCENNPRKYSTSGSSIASEEIAIHAGEAMEREEAAFLTDTGLFSGVPLTVLVEARHPRFFYRDGTPKPKLGSLQVFVQSSSTAGDFSPHLFPVEEVHKIAILDIRLLNTDRNDANLLVRRTRKHPLNNESSSPEDFNYELIPVDHGYCIPDRFEVNWFSWCWIDWPQTRVPFSAETKKWIKNYDIEANIELLHQQLNIRKSCLENIRFAGTILKKGAAAGLCLHDIASLIARQHMNIMSPLEHQIMRSQELATLMIHNARIRGESVGNESFQGVDLKNSSLSAKRRMHLMIDTQEGIKRSCSMSTIVPAANHSQADLKAWKDEAHITSPQNTVMRQKWKQLLLSYFDHLVDDMILSLQQRSNYDASYFRKSPLYQLTSPHRNQLDEFEFGGNNIMSLSPSIAQVDSAQKEIAGTWKERIPLQHHMVSRHSRERQEHILKRANMVHS